MVVRASLGMVDPILLAQIPYMGVDKCCAIKRENVLGNPKHTKDVTQMKVATAISLARLRTTILNHLV